MTIIGSHLESQEKPYFWNLRQCREI